jgi:hypothetical protein
VLEVASIEPPMPRNNAIVSSLEILMKGTR